MKKKKNVFMEKSKWTFCQANLSIAEMLGNYEERLKGIVYNKKQKSSFLTFPFLLTPDLMDSFPFV